MIDLTNSPPPGLAIDVFGGLLTETPNLVAPFTQFQTINQKRDRLLNKLFHVHPNLWHLFAEKQWRLEEIQERANFDLNKWLSDFRNYHNDLENNMGSILTRWH